MSLISIRPFASFFAALLLAATPLLSAATAQQQLQRTEVDTYAITGARIVTVSGPTIARGTIVIRRGLISAVGADVAAPADARVIDGAGLTVYPGLIDANTTLGMPQAVATSATAGRGGAAQQQQSAYSSPNSTQPPGLQPEVLAADLIRPGGEQIDASRNVGITSALTAPREGILIGQSALINLAGDTPQTMIVRSPVALHIGFTPLRAGTYPTSLMGVFAVLRQMFLDAGRLQQASQIYERNPRGMRRPGQDKSLEALYPVLSRAMPVVMNANSEREIRRALDLAEEFKLRAVIAGGLESWKVADRLRETGTPVLLSLNFPRRTTAASPEADPEPLRVLRERVEAPKTAGRLAAARVIFAFQSGAMTSMADFLGNAAKAVDNGLSRDDALRAMTIRPAEILGVADRLGSIEVGKIANLTITRGDLFDRPARIAQVFIDGVPVELRPAASAVTPGAGIATGTWNMNVNLGQGDKAVTLILQQEGERLRGSLQGALGTAEIANGSVGAGGDVRFTAPLNIEGQTTEATFSGTIAGDSFRGTVEVTARGAGTFTGTRVGRAARPQGAAPAPVAAPSPTPGPGEPAAPEPQPGPSPSPSTMPPRRVRDSSDALPGTWTLSFVVAGQVVNGTLILKQQGGKLSGTMDTPFGTTALEDGSVDAVGFHFTSSAEVGGRVIEMAVTGNAIGGNQMTGSITSDIGSISFTGTRAGTP